ncbi:zinc finger protein 251-like [Thalassophryne amazonica]|uniref:zinc finger protein 251-like n=1 Tax=Thalassophryne amazonica TaxID=390379 RepID=UPI001472602A|nr:zinc finger protein 251-like [Thalassophryne amazonica]
MQPLLVIKEEALPEHQERNLSVDQEDIKEEKLCISQQGEQLQKLEEADLTKFGFTAVPVKTENDEKPESSQLHQSRSDESTEAEPVSSSSSVHRTLTAEADVEDDGGQQPDSNSGPNSHLQPDSSGRSSDSSGTETDDSYDWKQTKELQSHFNCQKNINSVGSSNCNFAAKPFHCSKFVKAAGYMSIIEQHTGRQASGKPFSYSDQSKRQKQKGTLNKNRAIHKGQKQFACSECGRRFGQKITLDRHMIIHTGQKQFVCSECGRSFGRKGTLDRHMIIHTGQKPFGCSECGRRFGQKSHLDGHIRIHTGHKQFWCSECGQRFRLMGGLIRHMKIHTEHDWTQASSVLGPTVKGFAGRDLDMSACEEHNGATSLSAAGRHLSCGSTQLDNPPYQHRSDPGPDNNSIKEPKETNETTI